MDPWWGKGLFLAATAGMAIVRYPHIRRSVEVAVVAKRHAGRERALLGLVTLGLLAQLAWVVSPLLSFADYGLRPWALGAGAALVAAGLGLLHRSHADLGRNWSNTLELREDHRLVTAGVYRRIRHPMYTSLILYSAGLALAMPNAVAGPAFLAAFGTLVALRLPAEERMMEEAFGDGYCAWAAGTKRLVPGVW